VNATDRRPMFFEGRYLWHNRDHKLASGDDRRDQLPADVFDRLAGYMPRENPLVTTLVKAYPTQDAAMRALRAAECRCGGLCDSGLPCPMRHQ
jgi:hypothetical protein